jgi:thiol-disulfide isomerase/thioredoxin
MHKLILPIVLIAAATAAAQPRPQIVRETRIALNRGNFDEATRIVDAHGTSQGKTAPWLEAHSWLARYQLSQKNYAAATELAGRTRAEALAMLKARGVDEETSLPLALGASIEVQAQALEAQGQRSEAVAFLQDELARWRATSMRIRIQKNLNLITLEGKPAPAIDFTEYLGTRPPSLASLRGKNVILFFWAHWCGDCKRQAPILAQLKQELGDSLVVVGPTQTYGYVAGGEEAPRAEEVKYIDSVRQKFFDSIPGLTVPVNEETFRNWGASTTPTLAVIDPAGIVRLYHPGRIEYDELRRHLTPATRTE